MKVEIIYLPYDEVIILYTDADEFVGQVFMSDYSSPFNMLHH